MNPNIDSAWCAATAILKERFTLVDAKKIVELAGFDVIQIAQIDDYWKPFLNTIKREFFQFDDERKYRSLNIVVEEVLNRNNETQEQLEKYLSRLGWKIIDGNVIPIELLDRSELEELDEVSRDDLIKSAKRFRDGDLSGAISAACGAVDSITNKIYQKNKNLGDPTKASFQQRCTEALKAVGVFTAIGDQLQDIDWKDSGIVPFNKNLEGSLNQAAFVMQNLRANMSDVHGTKPVLRPLVFDSIKWAQILVRLLSNEYNK